jgi:hypothetical protein
MIGSFSLGADGELPSLCQYFRHFKYFHCSCRDEIFFKVALFYRHAAFQGSRHSAGSWVKYQFDVFAGLCSLRLKLSKVNERRGNDTTSVAIVSIKELLGINVPGLAIPGGVWEASEIKPSFSGAVRYARQL